jgi:taurine dioxygenase
MDARTESAAAELRITKLAPAVGAEVTGIALDRPLDEASIAALRQAWHAHAVLVVRGQRLSEADQIRFGGYFGALAETFAGSRSVDTHPAVMLVSNIRKDGKPIGRLPDGEMLFHSDQCYTAAPPDGAMLYAIEVPKEGGNTMFASMEAAYETLAPEMKTRLVGLMALNAYDLQASATTRNQPLPADAPRHVHPVVRTHPATGRKALYLNRLMTIRIEGMDESESEALLTLLFDHAEERRFVYEHRWQPGDVVLWDNRSTLHARTDFSPDERRLLRRIVVLREHED